MDTTLIDKLDFGRDSAETEQEFLQKVFLPTAVFKRVKEGRKQIILGRKGSGKTAICLRFFDDLKQQGEQVSLITPRDLSAYKMSLMAKGSVNPAESALLAWKYVFLVEIGKYIMGTAREKWGEKHVSWPESAQDVRKFLANNVNNQANWIDKVFKIARSVKKVGLKTPLGEGSVDLGTSEEASDFVEHAG